MHLKEAKDRRSAGSLRILEAFAFLSILCDCCIIGGRGLAWWWWRKVSGASGAGNTRWRKVWCLKYQQEKTPLGLKLEPTYGFLDAYVAAEIGDEDAGL